MPQAATLDMINTAEPGSAGASARHDEFVSQNLRRVFLQIYRVVRRVDVAQDLTQEVFIKALQREDQLKDARKAVQWLSRIAANTAIDYLRRQGRASFAELDELPGGFHATHTQTPEQILLRSEQRALLEDGLEVLTARERAALLLRDVEGVPAEQVAREMNCSMATVRSHIANARIKFRRYLERQRGGNE